MVNPVLHVSGFQKFPNQADKVLIFDSSAENINKNMVVNIVKTAFDVALNEPFHPCKSLFDLQKCRVATPVRSESVGMGGESTLVNTFQYHSDNFLQQFVVERGNTQGTLFLRIALFVDISSAGRVRFVAEIFQ